MIVPTPAELQTDEHGVCTPSFSNGSNHALPMTDEDKAALSKRKKVDFGFRAPNPLASKALHPVAADFDLQAHLDGIRRMIDKTHIVADEQVVAQSVVRELRHRKETRE